VVVHAVGGWVALPAVMLLGARRGRYSKNGAISAHPPSSIPFLALGAWVLAVGWFGFNVMSAQTLDKINGLVALNSLMAMVGGTLAGVLAGKNDPGFAYNGPLAGLVAICAGSDLMHPLGALVTGAIAGGVFVWMFTLTQNKWKIDDVLGVWPLHGLCGAWGGIAAGIFGQRLGGLGGVSFFAQLIGTLMGIGIAFASGWIIVWAVEEDRRHPARSGRGIQRRRPVDTQRPQQHGAPERQQGNATRFRYGDQVTADFACRKGRGMNVQVATSVRHSGQQGLSGRGRSAAVQGNETGIVRGSQQQVEGVVVGSCGDTRRESGE
jgi:hypothetical protein